MTTPTTDRTPESLTHAEPDGRPIRALHVLKQMTGGGVESWLLHVLRHMDRSRLHIDVMVRDPGEPRFEEEIRALGASVMQCARPKDRWTFARVFRDLVAQHGPYDVIHCHNLYNRGYVLRLARLNGVPVRIAHSHNAPVDHDGAVRRFRRGFRSLWLSPWWTAGLACSRPAAEELFGRGWEGNPLFSLLYCGVDLSPFEQTPDLSVRAALGLPEDAYVVGHVGRFDRQKNHAFLVEVAAAACADDARLRFLLVGAGELREDVEARVAAAGLSERFTFAGPRPDVPRLMRGAMDAFLLPSFHEGLPLVGMEAQAAGLPIFVSDAVTGEMDVLPGMVHRLSLGAPARAWAEAIHRVRRDGPPLSRAESLSRMEQSPFNIRNSVAALTSFYEERLGASGRKAVRPTHSGSKSR